MIKIEHILVPTDFSEPSDSALATALLERLAHIASDNAFRTFEAACCNENSFVRYAEVQCDICAEFSGHLEAGGRSNRSQ